MSWALGQALLSLQLPAQEVNSLCVNKAQGQQMSNCQSRRSFSQAWAGQLQGIKHSFQAAFGQGTDSLDSYKAGPAKGAAKAAQEQRSLSAAWFEKNPSSLLLIKLLKKGVASGGVCK